MPSSLRIFVANVAVFLLSSSGVFADEFNCSTPVTKVIESRIVGGKAASPPDWPFIVAMFSTENGPPPFCGGSLISEQWVLTAAHCVYHMFSENSLDVRRAKPDGTPAGERAHVTKVLIHPDYVHMPDHSEVNDVALLKLDRPIGVETSQLAIAASKTTEHSFGFANVCASTGGWGTTKAGGDVSKILRDVDVPIISEEDCRSMQGASYNPSAHICAGYKQGSKDGCQGDSGGPLVVHAGLTGFLLVGVVSFGKGCGQPNAPGIYSRVSTYRDWIVKTIGEN